jgi:hypothetical protein
MNLQMSFAERVSAYVDQSDELLDEIRRAATYLRQRQGYALWKLQAVTQLHKNSLLRLDDRTWVPKPETMVALAKLVERARAHRRGETFEFVEHPRPGRPRNAPVPGAEIKVTTPKLKKAGNGNGKSKRRRKTTAL